MAKRKTRAETQTESEAPLVPTGALAVALLGLAGQGAPLVHVARDERRLEAIAAILRALDPGIGIAILPGWDCLPYDRASPSRGVMGARAGVLRWLTDAANRPHIVLTTPPALIQRVPPPATWADARVVIRVGDSLDAEAMTEALRRLGYILDDRVDEPGEFAIRGRTLDVFPAASPLPCRVEHDGTRVAQIRAYDPLTQRSHAQTEELVIDPATEIILPPGSEERLQPFTGQEHGLARFYPALASLLDTLPEARLVVEAGAEARTQAFFEQIADGRESGGAGRGKDTGKDRGKDKDKDKPGADPLYLAPKEWARLLRERALAAATEAADVSLPAFIRQARPTAAFAKTLRERLKAGDRIVLAGPERALRRLVRQAERSGERRVRPVADWAAAEGAKPGEIVALEAPLDAGFRVPEAGLSVFAAADLYGHHAGGSGPRAASLPLGEVELRTGDVAVDRDNGLCVFEGLERVGAGEALRLRFAGDDVLMLPVDQADRVWRYGSDPEAVGLDKLSSASWRRRHSEAEATIARTARAMVALAGERAEARAPVLRPPEREMERFGAGFGFSLTPDQAAATDAVLADLASGRPMDRLVCGDVGFGKTEVALRAIAAAVFAGKQVALVAPTTVLVRQHMQTLERRFGRFGIAVAQLSRLVGPAEARRVKAGLADGSIRIVVGTNALAGKGVAFADLGLTVIDEEQRFGAKMKESLRALAGGGHVLTLTATPIPRTLQSALVGLRALSVIATPPAVRQPIRTVIAPFEAETVRAALMREHRRGGQSFVVCPRIEDLEPMAERLKAIVPDLAITLAHGAMKPAEMDAAMIDFADGTGDVLLATSIIESGLDVPRANTMLVWNAERFGLAQLHQLRGRVGRGQRRGAAYLLNDPERPLSAGAEKRLRTLEALDRLGAGFTISARDLDHRGAGDLVGDAQAGHVRLIGLGLYQHVLQLALRAAKGEPAEDWRPEINLGLEGAIPPDYMPEPEIRLGLYTRLLRVGSPQEIDALCAETDDRFGRMPESVETLVTLARLRVQCGVLGISRLSGGPQGVAADFRDGRRARALALDGDLTVRDGRVILKRPAADAAERGRLAVELLERVAEACEAA
ncbi:DEAD/DEAH box helicase [Methylobacterium radiodurans]|uniref:Transcription-repair-coupling factor n=1 Tax=Methylobacterium radiodurans TaxID=2202828 RepID=A0A2U8VMN7_9HYPH|nr:DEAD/DEAH box helicase [Methylobacterium radiodurans]AWN34691.1 DEAD/DEAH box helicase [Methylobacterium radiodurans]